MLWSERTWAELPGDLAKPQERCNPACRRDRAAWSAYGLRHGCGPRRPSLRRRRRGNQAFRCSRRCHMAARSGTAAAGRARLRFNAVHAHRGGQADRRLGLLLRRAEALYRQHSCYAMPRPCAARSTCFVPNMMISWWRLFNSAYDQPARARFSFRRWRRLARQRRRNIADARRWRLNMVRRKISCTKRMIPTGRRPRLCAPSQPHQPERCDGQAKRSDGRKGPASGSLGWWRI